jgi:hypothetical protein
MTSQPNLDIPKKKAPVFTDLEGWNRAVLGQLIDR